MEDELSPRIGIVVTVEKVDYRVSGRDYALLKQRLIPGMFVRLKHEPDQFRAGNPFVLMPGAFLKRALALFHRRPAVGRLENVAPEHDPFREVGGIIKAEIFFRPVLVQRQNLVRIHAKQGFKHFIITVGTHAVIGQTGVLPPVARPPLTKIRVTWFACGWHRED